MSSTYTGNAANVSNSLTATITGVSTGPNSVVTTAANHDFNTGDQINIESVVGITGVNNSTLGTAWTITVLTPTTFQINNGATTGAYASGGTATDQSLTPAASIPSDGDSFDVASVNVALETLFDRTQFLAAQLTTLNSTTFTYTGSSQTFVVPPGCFWMIANMCGGGGGGEGGCRASSGGSYPQGGGGAGAPGITIAFQTTPGATLTLVMGAGGAGGIAGGGAGADGGDSTISTGFNYPARARGGAGCGCGFENYNGGTIGITTSVSTPAYTDTYVVCAPGAVGVGTTNLRQCPFSLGPRVPTVSGGALLDVYARVYTNVPRQGGTVIAVHGYTPATGGFTTNGSDCEETTVAGSSFPGGAAGTPGVDGSPSYPGGYGGGGGGSSAFGAGGAGGTGGAGNASGAGGNGNTGSAGSTGAGGGGGGCGGYGSTSNGTGGAGGAGGNGKIVLYWAQTGGGL